MAAATDRAADAERLRRAVAANPGDRVSWHNLAAAEGDLGRPSEAEAAARRAIELGIPAPETRLVLARALQGQRRLDEAQRAFEEAIALRPAYVDAHRDLAQLLWMRTADAAAALRPIERAIAAAPAEAGLHHVKSVVLEFAGDARAALAAAQSGLAKAPDDVALLRQASHLCAEAGDAQRSLGFARRALERAPPGSGAEMSVCEAYLAAGRLAEAAEAAAALCAALPLNQYALALQATAWRLQGDPRYAALCDYAGLVSTQTLDVPAGWPTLEAFLRDLAAELESLHGFRAHPLQQSVRGGSQVTFLEPDLARPRIGALFRSIGVAVERHLARLGHGPDPMRSRNNGRFGIAGAWSVRLDSGGHHADHVHPRGWLSSACYISLPPAIGRGGRDDRAGWLRLGRPGVATRPALEADHHVRPEPGLLVLFPAYMWHGVEPFESDKPRLSVAFDAVPG